MKLHEIFYLTEKMDLDTIRYQPELDRGSIQRPSQKRKPVITLRHINKLKRMKAAQRAEHEKRQKLVQIMYATPAEE